jgi:hypothetical protein
MPSNARSASVLLLARAFLPGARRILQPAESAAPTVKRIPVGDLGTVVIGFTRLRPATGMDDRRSRRGRGRLAPERVSAVAENGDAPAREERHHLMTFFIECHHLMTLLAAIAAAVVFSVSSKITQNMN